MYRNEPSLKDYKNFILEFNKFRDECNFNHKEKESNKYYLVIVNNLVYVELENNYMNSFVVLGYFNNLGDCQKAKVLFNDKILEFNKYGFWN